jgi:hypothetical protein
MMAVEKTPTKKNLEKTLTIYTSTKIKRDTKKMGRKILETQ